MPGRRYDYRAVNHHNFESCSVQTRNDNLGDTLLYLNAVVTPKSLQSVRGLKLQKNSHQLFPLFYQATVRGKRQPAGVR